MPLSIAPPLLYLITDGVTNPATTVESLEYARLLRLIAAAAENRLALVQIREKSLSPRVLYELTRAAAALVQGTQTALLVNDRADIARAAGADGVHLTTQSLSVATIRRAFGPDLLVGVSTHSLAEVRAAREGGADFVTFGPVFDTPSKRAYGPPVGIEKLRGAAREAGPPLLALGGITPDNAALAYSAGAAGVAAIRCFSDPDALAESVRLLRAAFPGRSPQQEFDADSNHVI